MIIKTFKKIFSAILSSFGMFIFIFINFIYEHVGWLDTNTFQINTVLATTLSVFIFLLGLVSLLKNTTKLFDSSPKLLFIIRGIVSLIFAE